MAKNTSNSSFEAFKQAIDSSFAKCVEQVVSAAFAQKRAVILRSMYNEWSAVLNAEEGETSSKSASAVGWEEIVSLSSLRKIVGGRFQLLRERWMKAGFPLKEHRGTVLDADSSSRGNPDEFFSWLDSQGFLVRRQDDKLKSGILFEIKRRD